MTLEADGFFARSGAPYPFPPYVPFCELFGFNIF